MSRISRTVFLSCAIPHIFYLYLKVLLEATYEKALEKDALMDVSYELDHLLVASPASPTGSASVLDIMAASGSRTLPNEAFAEVLSEDEEAGGSKLVGYQLDALDGSLLGSGPVSASVLDIASGSRALPREAFAVEADQGYLPAENATTSTRQN